MHSLERSARARFQPGERPSLTSPPPWSGGSPRAWSACTTYGSGYSTPWRIDRYHEPPHTRDTNVGIYPRDVLCGHTFDRSIVSNIRDHHVFFSRSVCRLSRVRRNRDHRPICLSRSVSFLSQICDLIGGGRHTDLCAETLLKIFIDLREFIYLHPIHPSLSPSHSLHFLREWLSMRGLFLNTPESTL